MTPQPGQPTSKATPSASSSNTTNTTQLTASAYPAICAPCRYLDDGFPPCEETTHDDADAASSTHFAVSGNRQYRTILQAIFSGQPRVFGPIERLSFEAGDEYIRNRDRGRRRCGVAALRSISCSAFVSREMEKQRKTTTSDDRRYSLPALEFRRFRLVRMTP